MSNLKPTSVLLGAMFLSACTGDIDEGVDEIKGQPFYSCIHKKTMNSGAHNLEAIQIDGISYPDELTLGDGESVMSVNRLSQDENGDFVGEEQTLIEHSVLHGNFDLDVANELAQKHCNGETITDEDYRRLGFIESESTVTYIGDADGVEVINPLPEFIN